MRAMDAVPGWLLGRAGPQGLRLQIFAVAALTIAIAGLLAAGMGALGVGPFQRMWRRLAVLGAMASVVFLLRFQPPLALPGVLLSVTLVVLVPWLGDGFEPRSSDGVVRRLGRTVATAVAVGAVAYAAAAVVLRPWHTRWGSTPEELGAPLPGDELIRQPVRYGMQHAVTIRAPAEAVWPWLVQIGQDRGGFYSHDWLERLFGVDIRNADEIVPGWQHRAAGDSVFATQSGYLGLFDGRLGWRVARVDPGSALVLENWGAFVLVPQGREATRLIVRTRGGGPEEETLLHILLGPAGLLAFELPHFIMQRGMMLGIKARAEAEWRRVGALNFAEL
jgi:hypothetical protein